MIKQDYLIRMIQEIISLIVNALLKKKKYRWNEWTEYDGLTRQILGFPTDELLSMNTQARIGQQVFLIACPDERGISPHFLYAAAIRFAQVGNRLLQ